MTDRTDRKAPPWLAPTIAVLGLFLTGGTSYVVGQVGNEARYGDIEKSIGILEVRLDATEGELNRRLGGIEEDVDKIAAKIDRLLEARN